MDAFDALSAPIRRQILSLLSAGESLSATEIAQQFRVSAPAISQHLNVLLNTQLITMHKEAQKRIYQLNPLAMKEFESWAQQMAQKFDMFNGTLENPDSKPEEA